MPMRRRGYLFASVLWVSFAVGCATHRSVVTSMRPLTDTLDVLGVVPAKGEPVSRDSVIVAQLGYSVTNFRDGQFFVMPQLATRHSAATRSGRTPAEGFPVLKNAAGTLSFSLPLADVWDDPDIRRPFRIWFYLNESAGPQQSRVVAKTGPIEYKTR